MGYYAQSVGGHVELMRRSRPVTEWLADPATTPDLRERLALTQRMREFAVQELKPGQPNTEAPLRLIAKILPSKP